MSRRALIVALGTVSLALALAVGVLVGSHFNSGGGQGRPDTDRTTTTSMHGSATSAAIAVQTRSLSNAETGTAAANLACMELQASISPTAGGDAHYFVVAITIHGLDTGQISETGRNADLDEFDRESVQTAHSELAQAATEDRRWSPLQNLVRTDESAAIARWDQGGVIPAVAVDQTVPSVDIDALRGYCTAAKIALTAYAQHRNLTDAALLLRAGASRDQVRQWRIWSD